MKMFDNCFCKCPETLHENTALKTQRQKTFTNVLLKQVHRSKTDFSQEPKDKLFAKFESFDMKIFVKTTLQTNSTNATLSYTKSLFKCITNYKGCDQ